MLPFRLIATFLKVWFSLYLYLFFSAGSSATTISVWTQRGDLSCRCSGQTLIHFKILLSLSAKDLLTRLNYHISSAKLNKYLHSIHLSLLIEMRVIACTCLMHINVPLCQQTEQTFLIELCIFIYLFSFMVLMPLSVVYKSLCMALLLKGAT